MKYIVKLITLGKLTENKCWLGTRGTFVIKWAAPLVSNVAYAKYGRRLKSVRG
ncbi:MAG: hypothetical protein ACTS4T_01725 [Candidatus Hodgkinia cicadicola]